MAFDNDIIGTKTIEVADEQLLLLPDKAVYLPIHSILIISDVHLGKITHFRKHGIGIPQSAMHDNFERLALLIDSIEPKRVIFLGDLFHSTLNSEWQLLMKFIYDRQDTSFELILGNHDILDPKIYEQSNLLTFKSESIGRLLLTHEPLANIPSGRYNIYGHIHPAVKLSGAGKQTLRLACYFFSEHYAVMPAFGTFTGMHTLKPKNTDNIYVIADDKILQVS